MNRFTSLTQVFLERLKERLPKEQADSLCEGDFRQYCATSDDFKEIMFASAFFSIEWNEIFPKLDFLKENKDGKDSQKAKIE